MFGEKGISLIKEVHRNPHTITPYNVETVADIKKEILELINQNRSDAHEDEENTNLGEAVHYSSIRVRHAAVQRNLRCLLAYHYNRVRKLRQMRWEFGSILPPDIKTNLNPTEAIWFTKYSSALARYMRTIGDEGGVNLAVDLKPPKTLYVEVKCLVDYGRYELSDGSVLFLKENSRHFLPRVECEELIRQGIFQHIVN